MFPTTFSALEFYCSHNCFHNTLNDMSDRWSTVLIVTSPHVLSSWWWIFWPFFLNGWKSVDSLLDDTELMGGLIGTVSKLFW